MLTKELDILLGDVADNFSEEVKGLALKIAMSEVEEYCGRDLDYALELCALKIAVIKLNRVNTEGLASQAYSGVSESFIDGYPADIKAILNRKRKVKFI